MTDTLRVFFEAVPIFAALIAVLACGKRAALTSDSRVRLTNSLAVVSAVLMIAAQVSWSWSMFVQKSPIGTELADVMWTIFNTLVMVIFACSAQWRDE